MYVSLIRTGKIANSDIKKLVLILNDMPQNVSSRYAIAEIIIIRAAAIFEKSISDIAYKITCGAQFRNNTQDNFLVAATSIDNARKLMLSNNGALPRPKPYLKWTKASFIADSVKGVIDTNSHFLQTVQSHGAIITEIFEVRHHVAHRNTSSRKNFQKWVRQQYGQERPISIGYFLLTKNFSEHSNLERYLRSIPVILDDIINGQ